MQLEIGECFETVNDALVSAVLALGGNKMIGAKLRPEQFVLILRLAREKSYHAAMDFIAADTGYKAVAVDPESQQTELQRQFIAAVAAVQHIGARIEANGSRLYTPLRSAA